MSDEDALIAAEAAEDYKRQVERAGTVRVRAGDLMAAFGLVGMGQEARESVADALWEAGVCAEPSLAGAGIDVGTKIKLAPVDTAQVNAAVAWRRTPAGKRAASPEVRYAIGPSRRARPRWAVCCWRWRRSCHWISRVAHLLACRATL